MSTKDDEKEVAIAAVNRRARSQRRANYIFDNKGDIRGLLGKLETALNSGATAKAGQALEELAQHHTDLENAIEGNG